MEGVSEGIENLSLNDTQLKRNRIQVSNTKKPLFFYVNLSKRYLQQHDEVELSGLGMDKSTILWQAGQLYILLAIATVVTVAEILKNNGFAVEKKIFTSTIDMKEETRGRAIQKAKVEIILVKSSNFDELMASAAAEKELVDVDENS